jgi:F-box and leucine-rich repeat protein GRR1
MYNEAEDGDPLGDVTAQANDMAIDEMNDNEDDEFGNDSEMMG